MVEKDVLRTIARYFLPRWAAQGAYHLAAGADGVQRGMEE